jgi:ferredoxin
MSDASLPDEVASLTQEVRALGGEVHLRAAPRFVWATFQRPVSDGAMAIERALRSALDPRQVLNPGACRPAVTAPLQSMDMNTSAAGTAKPSTDLTAKQRSEAALIASAALDCVHCGLCLSSCPTYMLNGREPKLAARSHST